MLEQESPDWTVYSFVQPLTMPDCVGPAEVELVIEEPPEVDVTDEVLEEKLLDVLFVPLTPTQSTLY